MAELLPPTRGKPAIEKSGLGLLIPDTASHDPITITGRAVEIMHTEARNAPEGEGGSPAALMADVVEERVADPVELELRSALERDLCQPTIHKADMEAESEGLEAVDVEGGKDVEGTVKRGDLHAEKEGQNAESVEDKTKNGRGYTESEVMAKPDDLHEKEGGENSLSIEDENRDSWGYVENEGILKLENCREGKDEETEASVEDENGDGLGYVKNEGTVRHDIFHGENVYIDNEGTWKLDNLHKTKGGENTVSVEDQNENSWGLIENVKGSEENERNGGGKPRDAMAKLERYNQSNDNRRINYPMRPDAEDCAYYMKSGSCKFGWTCKFNHPPRRKPQVGERAKYGGDKSDRAGQTECKYYLVSGRCRYGNDCRFSHGSGNSFKPQILEFNFLGLPIRPGEKECPYYMRNGTCKYGSNCRFHHPEPTTVSGADSSSGYGNGGASALRLIPSSSMSSWSSPRAINEASSFAPAMFSGGQGAPSSNPEWNEYQTPSYTTSRSLPTPPAFALSNLPTEISFPMQHQHDMVLGEYPERPGEAECSFFMKTGDCKYKSNCKFHHPKNRIPKPKANTCTLNDKGLPLRPDEAICTYYHRYGICKYGPACKYDHPSSYANLPVPFDKTPFTNLKVSSGSQ